MSWGQLVSALASVDISAAKYIQTAISSHSGDLDLVSILAYCPFKPAQMLGNICGGGVSSLRAVFSVFSFKVSAVFLLSLRASEVEHDQ